MTGYLALQGLQKVLVQRLRIYRAAGGLVLDDFIDCDGIDKALRVERRRLAVPADAAADGDAVRRVALARVGPWPQVQHLHLCGFKYSALHPVTIGYFKSCKQDRRQISFT